MDSWSLNWNVDFDEVEEVDIEVKPLGFGLSNWRKSGSVWLVFSFCGEPAGVTVTMALNSVATEFKLARESRTRTFLSLFFFNACMDFLISVSSRTQALRLSSSSLIRQFCV